MTALHARIDKLYADKLKFLNKRISELTERFESLDKVCICLLDSASFK